ncbi:MAG: N-acetyltransferase, partial [Firmicutes bacterium]|nr:N-acetyltransferase [Bacillota bacterium]
MKYCQLRSGQTLVIRETEKEDSSIIIDYINKVGKETDNLTFGEGGVGISEDKETALIEAISKSDNQLMLCAFIDGNLVGHIRFTG